MTHASDGHSSAPIPRYGLVRGLLLPTSIAVIAIGIFAPLIRGGSEFSDVGDAQLVTQNPWVRSSSPELIREFVDKERSPVRIVPRGSPMAVLTFMLESHFLKAFDSPSPPDVFRRTNVILHAVTAVILWFILWRLFRSDVAATIGAALFAVHPLQVEAVSWIARREILLGGFFSLWCISMHIAGVRHRGERRVLLSWVNRIDCLFIYGLAVLSSAVFLPLPLILMLLDLWPLGRRGAGIVTEKLAMLGLMAGATTAMWMNLPAGGGSELLGWPAWTAVNVSSLMLRAVWPTHLCSRYPIDAGSLSVSVVLPAVAIVLALLIAAWTMRRRQAAWSFGIVAFLLAVAPAAATAPRGFGLASDSSAYLGIALLAIAVTGTIASVRRRQWQRLLAVAVVGVMAIAAVPQAMTWRNSEERIRQVLYVHPDDLVSRAVLAGLLNQQGRLEDALEVTEPFREMASRSGQDGCGVWYQYGLAVQSQGKSAEAMEAFREALRLDPDAAQPNHAIGAGLVASGDFEQAVPFLERARDSRPGFPGLRRALGYAFLKTNRPASARAEFQEAMALNPDDAAVQFGLACAWAEMGMPEMARVHLEAALAIDPEMPRRGARDPALRQLFDRPEFEGMIEPSLPNESDAVGSAVIPVRDSARSATRKSALHGDEDGRSRLIFA